MYRYNKELNRLYTKEVEQEYLDVLVLEIMVGGKWKYKGNIHFQCYNCERLDIVLLDI